MNIKHLLLPVLCTAFPAVAQQTMMGSSLTDYCMVADAGGDVESVRALCDKNDMSMIRVDDFQGSYVVMFTAERPMVVRGVNFVAGDDVTAAPVRATLEAYDEETSKWVTIARIMSLSYDGPYTSAVASCLASQTASRSKFRLTITKTGGSSLKLSEVQLLGYCENDARVVSTSDNGAYAYGSSADNSGSIGADDGRVVSLKDVKADYGINTYIDYEFDEPTVISGYGFVTGESALAQHRPKTWELLASNDEGATWSTLDMRNNEGSLAVNYVGTDYMLHTSSPSIDYAAASDSLFKVMQEKFYTKLGNGYYLLQTWGPNDGDIHTGINYWWMAHAVDAYIDAYARTKNTDFRTYAEQIKRGMYYQNNNRLWNTFYDDMEWMCLACIRGYENLDRLNSTWLSEAKQLYDWIWGGWSDVKGGGISWNTGSGVNSKNACSNAPAIICAAKLYQITGEQKYLDNAIAIHDWMYDNLRFEDGYIKDGVGNETRSWAFTYNQGTWVGGLMELYKITGDEKYYDTAVSLIDKCLNERWYSPDGIMREQGSGDGGLFKGIYIRYITAWVRSGLLDDERQYRYAKYLVENAQSLYLTALHKPEWRVMPSWRSRAATFNGENNGASNGKYDSSILLSGIFLFESVDMLRRDGILDDNYVAKNSVIGTPYKKYRMLFTSNNGGNMLQLSRMSLYGDSGQTGINDVCDDVNGLCRVSVSNGEIIVESDSNVDVRVYNMLGMLVASAEGSSRIACDKGIYIVQTGKTATKVVVR